MTYPDGWALYHWHGQPIEQAWIEGQRPSAADVLAEKNIELRRAGCEILGWVEILKQLNVRSIDLDDDPHIGELIEADFPDAPARRFLRCLCGTGREFIIPVDPSCSTALEANGWTYNFKLSDIWKPEVRT